MNYQEAWAFLDNLQFFKIKLGLDSIARFLDDLGQPHEDMKFVHVAGTNGKGSVSVTLLSLLSQAGYRVGLYTSPHLSSVRERFRINNSFISQEEFAETASRIRNILNGRQITYFEFTTAIAFLWFAKQQVDLAIMEVGMGGRLDATNVIRPLVGVITNVSMDHEAYLGNSLSEVAREKAGIIKKGVPVVSGVDDEVSRKTVVRTCEERKAPLYLFKRDFFADQTANGSWAYRPLRDGAPSLPDLTCGLRGKYQINNSALALASLELLEDHGFRVDPPHIYKGLKEVRWPGRLEYFCVEDDTLAELNEPRLHGRNTLGENRNCHIGAGGERGPRRFLLDGAHNPVGVESLKEALQSEFQFRKLIMVWGSMADKDIRKTLSTIAPLCDQLIFTMPEGERSGEPENLRAALPEEYQGDALCIRSVLDALQRACQLAGPEDLICVAGSLYLIGAARKVLLGDLVD